MEEKAEDAVLGAVEHTVLNSTDARLKEETGVGPPLFTNPMFACLT
jgi:hypothetical protein